MLITLAIISITVYRYQTKKRYQKIARSTLTRLMTLESARLTESDMILKLDRLMDDLVRSSGYSGHFGSNLKKNPPILAGYIDEVWKYHKIRNQIAHGDTPSLPLSTIRKEYTLLIKHLCHDLGA